MVVLTHLLVNLRTNDRHIGVYWVGVVNIRLFDQSVLECIFLHATEKQNWLNQLVGMCPPISWLSSYRNLLSYPIPLRAP